MRRIRHVALFALLFAGCGLPVADLLSASIASRSQIPPDVLAVCSPLFRSVDIERIVIEVNSGIDENVVKTTAITAADDACSETATVLLAAGEEDESLMFNELDAAVYRTDCGICYIRIIDKLYDR